MQFELRLLHFIKLPFPIIDSGIPQIVNAIHNVMNGWIVFVSFLTNPLVVSLCNNINWYGKIDRKLSFCGDFLLHFTNRILWQPSFRITFYTLQEANKLEIPAVKLCEKNADRKCIFPKKDVLQYVKRANFFLANPFRFVTIMRFLLVYMHRVLLASQNKMFMFI